MPAHETVGGDRVTPRVTVAEIAGDGQDDDRVEVRLLGVPSAWCGGRELPRPRGRKGWAVLAILALADRPVGRRELAGRLFGQADDPLGALRWSLADLRRALGLPRLLHGDPVSLRDPRLVVDAHVLHRGGADAARVAEQAGELLEGADLDDAVEFDLWLLVARQRLRRLADSQLRAAAAAALACGDATGAVRLAGIALCRSPYDEQLQDLLARALAGCGEHTAAASVRRCAAP